MSTPTGTRPPEPGQEATRDRSRDSSGDLAGATSGNPSRRHRRVTGTIEPTVGGGPERPGAEGAKSGTLVDPRLRARRLDVTRRHARRRRHLVLALAGLFTVAGSVWLALESAALDVDHITVAGAGDVPVETIVAASGIEPGDALAFVNTDAARTGIEALAGIEAVKVVRSFPATVTITVTQPRSVAWANRDLGGDAAAGAAPDTPGLVVLDAGGRVVGTVDEPPAGLSEIRGLAEIPPPGRLVRPARAVTLLTALPQGWSSQVEAVIVDHGRFTLALRPPPLGRPSAAEIRLGDSRDITAKGVAAAAVLGALDTSVGYLDVSVPSAPVTGG